jgi:hypothetical protein
MKKNVLILSSLVGVFQVTGFIYLPYYFGEEFVVGKHNKEKNLFLQDIEIYKKLPEVNCSKHPKTKDHPGHNQKISYGRIFGGYKRFQTLAYINEGMRLAYDLGHYSRFMHPTRNSEQFWDLFFNRGMANYYNQAKKFSTLRNPSHLKIQKLCKNRLDEFEGEMSYKNRVDLYLKKEEYADSFKEEVHQLVAALGEMDNAYSKLLEYRIYMRLIAWFHYLVFLLGYPCIVYIIYNSLNKKTIK